MDTQTMIEGAKYGLGILAFGVGLLTAKGVRIVLEKKDNGVSNGNGPNGNGKGRMSRLKECDDRFVAIDDRLSHGAETFAAIRTQIDSDRELLREMRTDIREIIKLVSRN